MSIEKVRAYLAQAGAADRIITFAASTATVALAAEALGCEEAHIAKSMSFLVDGSPLLVVLAGDVRVDNHKFKEAFHKKGRMIPFAEVEEYIGHAPGGVCPFAIKEGVPVYLDISLKRFATVYPAAGDDHSAVRVTPDELFSLARASGWVDVAKFS
ncbi:MAG: Proline--tRNA ligase [Mitsuokella multacida]|jgi:prolyl-tRNA editing enzyme YbaK/EbsC (Cys-tRNA(Pro) deacylase)